MKLDENELEKAIQNAVIGIRLEEQRSATQKDIETRIRRKYGDLWNGETIARRARQLYYDGILQRRGPGIFEIRKIVEAKTMKVNELKHIGEVDLVIGELIGLSDIKQTKTGKKMQTATLKDDLGEIRVTLWGKDCGAFKEKQVVEIHDGMVSEYQGNLSISSGMYGRVIPFKGIQDAAKPTTLNEFPLTHLDNAKKETSFKCPHCGSQLKVSEG